MIYNAIGLMSGSSLDGLDIALVRLEESAGEWSYAWIATDCVPYPPDWLARLKGAASLTVPQFLELDTAYGCYTGQCVQRFLQQHAPALQVDFIASHGHTVYHNPAVATTCQIGDGAAIAAVTGLPVISGLRNLDVALGGQGAPIVPVGDKLLFGQYDYLLNLGGIANITVKSKGLAFDICPCNQLLDYYAQKAGLAYDAGGALAKSGMPDLSLLDRLDNAVFYQQASPKSLSNDFSAEEILPLVDGTQLSASDALATCVQHIATQVRNACASYKKGSGTNRLLVTGGGGFNNWLISHLSGLLQPLDIQVVVPDSQLVNFKEALVMALIGALRWRNEVNVYASVTGAQRDSVGGAIWYAGR